MIGSIALQFSEVKGSAYTKMNKFSLAHVFQLTINGLLPVYFTVLLYRVVSNCKILLWHVEWFLIDKKYWTDWKVFVLSYWKIALKEIYGKSKITSKNKKIITNHEWWRMKKTIRHLMVSYYWVKDKFIQRIQIMYLKMILFLTLKPTVKISCFNFDWFFGWIVSHPSIYRYSELNSRTSSYFQVAFGSRQINWHVYSSCVCPTQTSNTSGIESYAFTPITYFAAPISSDH